MEMSVFLYTDVPLPWLRIDEKKRLEVWSCNLCLLEDTLYHKGSDGIWRGCVCSDEKDAVLQEAHYGIAGGHYTEDATTRKIWQAGL